MAMLIRTGSATVSLLAYAATNWPIPFVIPPGWSASWKHWDYLLKLFALSPYLLRLPQIEMLMNVKYAIPGQVRPIIYSDVRETLMSHDATRASHAHAAPDTVEEIVLLVAAAPTPEGVPMVKLEPDAEGEAALARILERDASVIPLLESDFLGYAPRATEPDEGLMSADEAKARQKEKFMQAIRNVEAYVPQTEELKANARELADLRAVGSPELLEQEGLDKDKEANAQMRVHLEDAKEKLKQGIEEGLDGIV
ncbi:hypothetical protein B0H13DRAFT_2289245 [Mycena leptocephala]|nr:hypothetical protein B0H13DRAFT_2289245 [Mycena leptocephala]